MPENQVEGFATKLRNAIKNPNYANDDGANFAQAIEALALVLANPSLDTQENSSADSDPKPNFSEKTSENFENNVNWLNRHPEFVNQIIINAYSYELVFSSEQNQQSTDRKIHLRLNKSDEIEYSIHNIREGKFQVSEQANSDNPELYNALVNTIQSNILSNLSTECQSWFIGKLAIKSHVSLNVEPTEENRRKMLQVILPQCVSVIGDSQATIGRIFNNGRIKKLESLALLPSIDGKTIHQWLEDILECDDRTQINAVFLGKLKDFLKAVKDDFKNTFPALNQLGTIQNYAGLISSEIFGLDASILAKKGYCPDHSVVTTFTNAAMSFLTKFSQDIASNEDFDTKFEAQLEKLSKNPIDYDSVFFGGYLSNDSPPIFKIFHAAKIHALEDTKNFEQILKILPSVESADLIHFFSEIVSNPELLAKILDQFQPLNQDELNASFLEALDKNRKPLPSIGVDALLVQSTHALTTALYGEIPEKEIIVKIINSSLPLFIKLNMLGIIGRTRNENRGTLSYQTSSTQKFDQAAAELQDVTAENASEKVTVFLKTMGVIPQDEEDIVFTCQRRALQETKKTDALTKVELERWKNLLATNNQQSFQDVIFQDLYNAAVTGVHTEDKGADSNHKCNYLPPKSYYDSSRANSLRKY